MSTTQDNVSYNYSAAPGGITHAGTNYNCLVAITIAPGTDFTDADAFALQSALAAAFPAAWGVHPADISLVKREDVMTQWDTDLGSVPPAFR